MWDKADIWIFSKGTQKRGQFSKRETKLGWNYGIEVAVLINEALDSTNKENIKEARQTNTHSHCKY